MNIAIRLGMYLTNFLVTTALFVILLLASIHPVNPCTKPWQHTKPSTNLPQATSPTSFCFLSTSPSQFHKDPEKKMQHCSIFSPFRQIPKSQLTHKAWSESASGSNLTCPTSCRSWTSMDVTGESTCWIGTNIAGSVSWEGGLMVQHLEVDTHF